MLTTLYNELLYKPLFNTLVVLYQYLTFYDLGLAIILLTIMIRILLFPLFHKTTKHQLITQALQPKIKEIQKTHKDNKETQAKAILDLYSKHKLNPFTPIGLLIIQLPILIALYQVFISGFSDKAFTYLYPFISAPETLNSYFLNLIDLSKPNALLVIGAALAQYLQGRITTSKIINKTGQLSPQEKMQKNMVYFGPAVAIMILWNFPAAIGLYWLTSTLFSLLQQLIVSRTLDTEQFK
ncbi:MAG TPA: YidC/Oxa1 family membrane protein insertase [Candidatus Paceibacterota bacterium]